VPDAQDKEEHWRSLAKEARSLLGQVTDPQARLELLRIAIAYERLASRAKRQKTNSEPESRD
jgi:hypothetical protein